MICHRQAFIKPRPTVARRECIFKPKDLIALAPLKVATSYQSIILADAVRFKGRRQVNHHIPRGQLHRMVLMPIPLFMTQRRSLTHG